MGHKLQTVANTKDWDVKFEQVGAYDRAETAIDFMLENTEHNPDILAEKRAFYSRLLAESDDELEEGGISREEVERKLSDLN